MTSKVEENMVQESIMEELVRLQVDELRLTGMYNILRSTPAHRRNTTEFLALLADLDARATALEELLDEMPNALPAPRLLVA